MIGTTWQSPLGPIHLVSNGQALTHVTLPGGTGPTGVAAGHDAVLQQAREELGEYFAGQRKEFSLPIAPAGTSFQQAAWNALCSIPYGETCSYGEQAARIGKPGAARAIGQANRANPIPILVPCHRVIAAGGGLGGYMGGGAEGTVKVDLLRLEGALPPS